MQDATEREAGGRESGGGATEGPDRPRRRGHAPWWLQWLPVLPALPFLPLFLVTALPRLLVPFELEWNEGHSAEQAWRFARGLPLYPPPEEGWVPYMYAPLYHVLHGALMALSGVYTLAWGRLISFVSSLLVAFSIYAIVHDRVRRAAPALAAALLFFAYYKPTGFWYDIVRVDSLAFALAGWGMYFTLKRHPRHWQAVVGLVLLALATWAKQTNGVIAVLCAGWILFRRPVPTVLSCLAIALVTANAVFFLMRGGSGWFLKYVYTNALLHPSMPNVYFPGYLSPGEFLDRAGNPEGGLARAVAWVRLWREEGPPQVWALYLRHAWLVLLAVPAWLVLPPVRRRLPRGWMYVVPCVALSVLAFQSYAKFGGYVNNFLSVYMAVCILFGLALGGLTPLWRNRWWRGGVSLAAMVLVTLQVFQPWNIPPAGDSRANWEILGGESNGERRMEMERWMRHLARKAEGGAGEAPEVSRATRLRHFVARVNHAGLFWFPSGQWPSAGSRAAFEDLIDWLRGKREAGEAVLVMHHQWYGLLAGHPMGMNIDMLRCAHWAGDPIPPSFLDELRGGRWPYIVLDKDRIEWEWMAANVGDVLKAHYDHAGTLPAISGAEDPRALMPVTGADMRPRSIWVHKSRAEKEAP